MGPFSLKAYVKASLISCSIIGSSLICEPANAFLKKAKSCMSRCTEDFCKESQENLDSCFDQCGMRYVGVIRACIVAGHEAGFTLPKEIKTEKNTEESKEKIEEDELTPSIESQTESDSNSSVSVPDEDDSENEETEVEENAADSDADEEDSFSDDNTGTEDLESTDDVDA